MISIIDYGAGNLRSVQKAFEFLGYSAEVTSDKEKILSADKVILPGVGAFGDCMRNLNSYDVTDCIHKVIENKTPFLGICLGLQLLFEKSEESEGATGLSVFEGDIIEIPKCEGLKIPHIGWNSIEYNKECPIFKRLPENPFVYFVHSYYMNPKNKSIISAKTEYGAKLPIALWSENTFATQFHPEKSGDIGLTILKNFAEL